jgi:two-component system response regulator YesN
MHLPEDHVNYAEQRDFWDSLQMDLLTANQKLSDEDYLAFIERSFMFSMLFRGCSTIEIIGFRQKLNLKDNGYLILLEFFDPNKQNVADLSMDELHLHHFIKKKLHNINCALGPLITNRISILVTEDSISPYQVHKEESTALCRELIPSIEKFFRVRVAAGIGSMHNIYSIYTSFIDALSCLHYIGEEQIVYFPDIKAADPATQFDYLPAEKHLLEAIRLRKTEAYDYFVMMMDCIRPFGDEMKKDRILEILILANHAMHMDSQEDLKHFDNIGAAGKLMTLSGDKLIDYAYQLFIYITSYVKPQNSIDYSNHIVMATREYLESHYADDISLEDMAEHVNISPQYFSKLIKKTTGFNFIDWLSMLRVRKAKELLTNSNLTVKEVCFMVGYKDPNYFSRIFKKRIGITPSEYVKANSFLSNKS